MRFRHSILFFLLLVLSTAALAERPKWTGHGSWLNKKGGNSGGGSGGGGGFLGIFRLMGALRYHHANFGSENGDVASRKLNGIGAEGVLGINLGPVMLGAGAEYSKFFQMTKPEDVDDTNLSGTMTNMFGAVALPIGPFALMGRYYLSSNFELSQKTEAGDSVEYGSAKGAIGASLMYRPGGRSYWSLDYTKITYEEETRAGETVKFEDGAAMNLSSIGLSYGFMF
jgi:hypothetical protein